MKRVIAMLLVFIMLFTLVACGGGQGEENTESKPGSQPTEKNEENATQTGAANKKTIETNYWSLAYDPEVWTYADDDFYDEDDWSKIELIIPEEDSYSISVSIDASLEDAENFRDYLTSYGFDEYDYAVNEAYELTSVGGVDCLRQEGNYWGSPCLRYFNRIEGAGVTVLITIEGEYEDARVEELLSGLVFTLEDIGNIDFPWYWEGEPFSAEARSAMVGTFNIRSEWLPFAECEMTKETFEHAISVVGNKAYVLKDGVFKRFDYSGTGFAFEMDIDLGAEYKYIQKGTDGTLWLSNFMELLVAWKDGAQVAAYEEMDYVSMHPSGTWGINWFSGVDCEKIRIENGAISTAPISFPELSTISALFVDENYIYVCGSEEETYDHKVFVYNADGVLQMTLAASDGSGLGSITYIAKTENGFFALDGNMRELVFWNQNGEHIGTIDDSDIFGTSYPWFCGASKLDDGTFIVIMTEERADESAMELVAFKITGF